VILQIDIGNTDAKWRCLVGGESLRSGRSKVKSLVGELSDVLCGHEFAGLPVEVQLASVADSGVTVALVHALETLRDSVRVVQATSAKEWKGVSFSYQYPESQGVDRCLAMLAAYEQYLPLREQYDGVMVVDAGSAITVDVLDSVGRQLKGYILPGYNMMRESLLGNTAAINSGYALGGVSEGLSTESCVEDGVAMSFYSVLRSFVAQAQRCRQLVVITGGDARRCKSVLADGVLFKPDLVFDGMTILFRSEDGAA